MKSSDEIETTENKVVKKVVVYAVMVALVFISAM
ncbi:cell division protein FtsL, partial [Klebsiella pneumoniae]